MHLKEMSSFQCCPCTGVPPTVHVHVATPYMYVPLWSDSFDSDQLSGDSSLVFDATDGEMRGLAVQGFTQSVDGLQRFLISQREGGREGEEGGEGKEQRRGWEEGERMEGVGRGREGVGRK